MCASGPDTGCAPAHTTLGASPSAQSSSEWCKQQVPWGLTPTFCTRAGTRFQTPPLPNVHHPSLGFLVCKVEVVTPPSREWQADAGAVRGMGWGHVLWGCPPERE